MSSITVFSERWLGFGGAYHVRIDDSEVGRLARRRAVTVELPPGNHAVIVVFGGRASSALQVKLKPGEDARVELKMGRGVRRSFRSADGKDMLLLSQVGVTEQPRQQPKRR
ncbi:hypothetical protein ACSMXN_02205 [Jatrophihabitans sp. DSM 45814]